MLDQITDYLYIGKAQLALRIDRVKEAQISSVVKLFESPPEWPNGFNLLDRPFPDGEFIRSDKLAVYDHFIAGEIAQDRRVLVACGAGISRSATIVLSTLVASGMALPDAYDLLKQKHPESMPHPVLWDSLLQHHKLPYTLAQVLLW
jgi:protein-tyrosine phosphatase